MSFIFYYFTINIRKKQKIEGYQKNNIKKYKNLYLIFQYLFCILLL